LIAAQYRKWLISYYELKLKIDYYSCEYVNNTITLKTPIKQDCHESHERLLEREHAVEILERDAKVRVDVMFAEASALHAIVRADRAQAAQAPAIDRDR
jgi:hypothetical protein